MLMAGCCVLGAIERGAFGFSNEKSFTYCARMPICGIAICGSGPPFVIDILASGLRAIVKAWLTQGGGVNKGGCRCAMAGADSANLAYRPKSMPVEAASIV